MRFSDYLDSRTRRPKHAAAKYNEHTYVIFIVLCYSGPIIDTDLINTIR